MKRGLHLFQGQASGIHGVIAMLLIAACLFLPEWRLPSKVFRTMVVLDITQSMNTRDYHQAGFPEDRLSYAKQALREWLHASPAALKLGLDCSPLRPCTFSLSPLRSATISL